MNPRDSIASRTAARLRERVDEVERARATLRDLRDRVNANDGQAMSAAVVAVENLGRVGGAWLDTAWRVSETERLVAQGFDRERAESITRRARWSLSATPIPIEARVEAMRKVTVEGDREARQNGETT